MIEIRNSETNLIISNFLQLQNLIFTGYDFALLSE